MVFECLVSPIDCFVGIIVSFFIDLINVPIKPLVKLIHVLLTSPANIDAFAGLWATLTYVISIFYGLFILFAGFNFIISGASAERRARAKQWLQNALLMIVFVQASFLLYNMLALLASGLTEGLIGMVEKDFFYFTLDNVLNVTLELVLGSFYLFILLITTVVLAVVHFLASIGVVFFPFGLFFYFIPPLKDVGKLIMNKVVFVLFIPFFAGIILVGGSVLADQWPGIKILLMIATFAVIDVLLVVLALLAILRAVFGVVRSDLVRGSAIFREYVLPPRK